VPDRELLSQHLDREVVLFAIFLEHVLARALLALDLKFPAGILLFLKFLRRGGPRKP
jgi:hypothetical protein